VPERPPVPAAPPERAVPPGQERRFEEPRTVPPGSKEHEIPPRASERPPDRGRDKDRDHP
jgi:hypothetical protein